MPPGRCRTNHRQGTSVPLRGQTGGSSGERPRLPRADASTGGAVWTAQPAGLFQTNPGLQLHPSDVCKHISSLTAALGFARSTSRQSAKVRVLLAFRLGPRPPSWTSPSRAEDGTRRVRAVAPCDDADTAHTLLPPSARRVQGPSRPRSFRLAHPGLWKLPTMEPGSQESVFPHVESHH